jgi:glycerol-3-phosphate acyltransferase PlsY
MRIVSSHFSLLTSHFFIFLIAFFCGSLPFSVWIGRWVLHTDIRQFGDGNPGATNVWRAGGGKGWTAVALLLDFAKGAIPVAWANFGLGLSGWQLTAVALAPILGHAFSPFLRFRGGKALAVTFGVWTGLTLWLVPTFLGLSFAIWLRLLKREATAVLLGMGTILPLLWLTQAEPTLYLVWLGNWLILAWTHKSVIG